MNPLSERLITGITGELLVQLRLFQHGVQAAPPLADSGNDLIAIRNNVFKAVQVKTSWLENPRFEIPRDRLYHILALVHLQGEENELHLDESRVYLVKKEEIEQGTFNSRDLTSHLLSSSLIDRLFPVNDEIAE